MFLLVLLRAEVSEKKFFIFFFGIQVKIPDRKRGGFTVNHRYFVESVWKKNILPPGF